jgi:hypothetical protein
MKKLFKTLFDIFDSMARARAATYLARQGNHNAARKVVQD